MQDDPINLVDDDSSSDGTFSTENSPVANRGEADILPSSDSMPDAPTRSSSSQNLERLVLMMNTNASNVTFQLEQNAAAQRADSLQLREALLTLSATVQRSYERSHVTGGYYRTPTQEDRRSLPVDVSDPSASADPKHARSLPKRDSASKRSSPTAGQRRVAHLNKTIAGTAVTKTENSGQRKFDYDDLEQDINEEHEDASSSHSTASRQGLNQFSELVADRKANLATVKNRYGHVQTVHIPLDDKPYTLLTNTVAAVVTWYNNLVPYAKNGGTLHYCDLINDRVREAIQRRSGITQAAFSALSNNDAIDHLFALVRPVNTLEWTHQFNANLKYPVHSPEFIFHQTVTMKLDTLATFASKAVDLVYVLGDFASPSDRDVRKMFEHLLPPTMLALVRDYSIDIKSSFLKFLEILKENVANSVDTERHAAPVRQLIVKGTSPVTRSQTQQSRPSTYGERARLNVLTADDIYGPGEEDPTEPPAMSPEETQLLEENGIFALVSPTTPTQYAAVKKELEYPPHLRFPVGKQPCWTWYNSNTCTNGMANCKFDHDRARIDQYVEIKRQREAYLPPRPIK